MSRLLKRDLSGIEINNTRYILSQFADDSVCYLRKYTDLPALWAALKTWCDATGMALNRTKTEGVRLGKSQYSDPPVTDYTHGINWVKPGRWITILGVPFGETPDLDLFFEEKYKKCKLLLAHWHAVKGLTTFGRAMIINALIYSRFRYWAFCMVIPDHVNACLASDAHAVLWDSNFAPHPDELGTETNSLPFIREGAAMRPRRKLGLGLLHWPSHVKAIQAQLITHYLSGTQSSWKLLLDNWFDRTPVGRGSVFATTPITDLIKTTGDYKSSLPPYFKQALHSFRYIDFVKVKEGEFLSPDEAKAEPVWGSRLFNLTNRLYYQSWMIEMTFNRIRDYLTPDGDLWTPTMVMKLAQQTFVTDYQGWIRLPGSRPINPIHFWKQWGSFVDQCPKYIIEAAQGERPPATPTVNYSDEAHKLMRLQGHVPGKGLGRNSDGITEVPAWDTKARDPQAGLGAPTKAKCTTIKNRPKRILYCKPGDTSASHHYGYIKHPSTPNEAPKFQLVRLTPLGRPRVTDETLELDFEPAPVVWWGPTVMGPAEVTYPHPKGWCTAGDTPITLDELNIKKLTAYFRQHLECEPTCMTAWPRYLALNAGCIIPWDAIGARLSSPLTTNKDTHSWFKNVLHRRLLVRTLKPHEGSSTCRLCNCTYERLEHLGSCPIIHHVMLPFYHLTTSTIGITDTCSPFLKLLGCTRSDNDPNILEPLPQGLFSLFLILWKFLIASYASTDTLSSTFSPNYIWRSTLKRYQERVNALHYSHQLRLFAALGKGLPPPSPNSLNKALQPLAHLDEEGSLIYHPEFLSLLALHFDPPPPSDSSKRADHPTPDPMTQPLHSATKPINFVAAGTLDRPRRGGGGA